MQITIDQLDLILRLHENCIKDDSLYEIYKGDHINCIQDSLEDKEDNGEISRIEKKILERMNAEMKKIFAEEIIEIPLKKKK